MSNISKVFRDQVKLKIRTDIFSTKSTFPVAKIRNKEITPSQAVGTLREECIALICLNKS